MLRSTVYLLGFVSLGTFVVPRSAVAGSPCLMSMAKLRKEIDRFDQLNKLKEELDKKFQSYVAQDYDDQSNGILEGIHRSAAKKVAFAKRRLEKSLGTQRESMEKATSEYCDACASISLEDQDRGAYCEKCSSQKICREQPTERD